MSYIGNQPVYSAFPSDPFSGDNVTTAFTLSVSPANPASVIVAVSGVLQDPTTYAISGRTLTFSGAPPAGTNNISVRYLGIPASGVTTTAFYSRNPYTATAGQTSFSVPSYTVGFVQVFRNGVLLDTTDYTATTGTTIVLNNGATVGDTVTVISFYISSVLNAIPNTAGSVTQNNLADGAVTQVKLGTNVTGNGPAFSAYIGSNQSVTNAWTKVQVNTEEFDTASCYDTTNYRFTPTVAGYYQLNASAIQSSSTNRLLLGIYKNGTVFKYGTDYTTGSTIGVLSTLVYANGTTDYFEFWVYSGGSVTLSSGNPNSYFQAFLVRSA